VLVGEFFEVRTQVDLDLTAVSRVDRRLGLIKNLGRHSFGDLFMLNWLRLQSVFKSKFQQVFVIVTR
jgi:hypothetical protein